MARGCERFHGETELARFAHPFDALFSQAAPSSVIGSVIALARMDDDVRMTATRRGRKLYTNMPELTRQLGGRRSVLEEVAGPDAFDQALKDIADFSDAIQGGASG